MVATRHLRSVAFFDRLTGAQLGAVAHLASEVALEAEQPLFHENEPADVLCVVLEGEVDLFHTVAIDGTAPLASAEAVTQLMDSGVPIPLLEGQAGVYAQQVVGRVTAGEVAGISALVPPYRFTATARAVGRTRLARIDAAQLRARCDEDPALGYLVMQAIARVAFERLHFARVRCWQQP